MLSNLHRKGAEQQCLIGLGFPTANGAKIY
jgi:hypothetical protein